MNALNQVVTFVAAGQHFAIPIASVQDAFRPHVISRVPKAPIQVAGVLNLRGRIVTAISLTDCLGLPREASPKCPIAVVIAHKRDLYCLLVQEMGEVLRLEDAWREESPLNLDPKWRSVSACVYRLKDKLLILLDVDRLLDFRRLAA